MLAREILQSHWLKSPTGRATARGGELVDSTSLLADKDSFEQDIQLYENMAEDAALLEQNFHGPFRHRDCWNLINFKFMNDVFLHRLLKTIKSKFDTKNKLVVIDPVITAGCISRVDLTLDIAACKRQVLKCVKMCYKCVIDVVYRVSEGKVVFLIWL